MGHHVRMSLGTVRETHVWLDVNSPPDRPGGLILYIIPGIVSGTKLDRTCVTHTTVRWIHCTTTRKDITPHNHTCGKFTTHHTCDVRGVWGHGSFFEIVAGTIFLFFFSKKIWESPSFLTDEERVKSNDKNDKRVMSIWKGCGICENKCSVSRNVNFELKYIRTDTSVSRQNTKKFSQSHSRKQSHSQSESRSRGPRPRRLTKTLEPPSQCPTGTDRSHRPPDDTRDGGWCVCARDTRQVPNRVCFSSLSGSNPRSTT